MKLTVGNRAPNFSAVDQNEKIHTLRDYKDQWVLLYFYPEDDTPGCITQACGLRDSFDELSKHLTIIGVSGDTVQSHARFAQKYQLPFTLLADPDKTMIQAYGTDVLLFSKRTSFLIDPHGTIARIYENVKPDVHAQEILDDLKVLIQ